MSNIYSKTCRCEKPLYDVYARCARCGGGMLNKRQPRISGETCVNCKQVIVYPGKKESYVDAKYILVCEGCSRCMCSTCYDISHYCRNCAESFSC